jgi:hypothetical protein
MDIEFLRTGYEIFRRELENYCFDPDLGINKSLPTNEGKGIKEDYSMKGAVR